MLRNEIIIFLNADIIKSSSKHKLNSYCIVLDINALNVYMNTNYIVIKSISIVFNKIFLDQYKLIHWCILYNLNP